MVDSIPRRLLANGTTRPSAIAYYAKSQGAWQPTTWKRFIEEVRTTARALMELGLEKGERVAILGYNRPEWTIFDHAAMLAGGVPAGIYTTCSAEEVFYILHHSEARAVLVENADQEEEGQYPDARKAAAPSGEDLTEYVHERLVKLRPSKKVALLIAIGAMFQFQGGISDSHKDRIVAKLQKLGHISIDQNNRVSFASDGAKV